MARNYLGVRLIGALLEALAAAATGIWSPQLGDSHRGHTTPSASGVPQAQLDHFGVLRRAPTEADRGVQSRYALRFLDPSFEGVRTDDVRLLDPGTPGEPLGGAQILISVRHGDGIDDALCLFDTDPADGGGLSCWSTRQVLEGRAIAGMLEPDNPRSGSAQAKRRARALRKASRDAKARGATHAIVPFRMTVRAAQMVGLVPDGVARVIVHDRRETHEVPVHDNFFSYTVHHPNVRPSRGSTITWQDADGRDLKTLPGIF